MYSQSQVEPSQPASPPGTLGASHDHLRGLVGRARQIEELACSIRGQISGQSPTPPQPTLMNANAPHVVPTSFIDRLDEQLNQLHATLDATESQLKFLLDKIG